MMTITAAQAVKIERSRDFAGELIDEKIPKATPVFRTYVMLKKPSITEIDSFRSNRFRIQDLLQRSKTRVPTTTSRYGSRPWSFDDIWSGLYLAGSHRCHALWYSCYAF